MFTKSSLKTFDLLYPRFIFFDLNRTLVNPGTIPTTTLEKTFNYFNLKSVCYEQEGMFHSTRDMFPIWFQQYSEELFLYFYERIKVYHFLHLSFLSGTEEFLKTIVSFSISFEILSNKNKDILEEKIDYLGWSFYFKMVIGSGTFEKDESHTDFFLKVLSSLIFFHLNRFGWLVITNLIGNVLNKQTVNPSFSILVFVKFPICLIALVVTYLHNY